MNSSFAGEDENAAEKLEDISLSSFLIFKGALCSKNKYSYDECERARGNYLLALIRTRSVFKVIKEGRKRTVST